MGTKFVFFQISLLIHVDCCHPRRVSPYHPAGSMVCMFCWLWGSVLLFFLHLNSCFFIALRILRGSSNADGFFRSRWSHQTVSALSVCSPSSPAPCATCCPCASTGPVALAPRPVCFFCNASAGSSLVKDGVCLGDRDGFSLRVRRVGFPGHAWFSLPSIAAVCWMLLLHLPMWSGLLLCGSSFGSRHCSLY